MSTITTKPNTAKSEYLNTLNSDEFLTWPGPSYSCIDELERRYSKEYEEVRKVIFDFDDLNKALDGHLINHEAFDGYLLNHETFNGYTMNLYRWWSDLDTGAKCQAMKQAGRASFYRAFSKFGIPVRFVLVAYSDNYKELTELMARVLHARDLATERLIKQ